MTEQCVTKWSLILQHSDAVSIKTHGNENIGINVEGSAEQGFYVKGVEPDSVAEASGKIETGNI